MRHLWMKLTSQTVVVMHLRSICVAHSHFSLLFKVKTAQNNSNSAGEKSRADVDYSHNVKLSKTKPKLTKV